MRIVFSRKGFDSASGGGPSPIVDGRPVSLPIPTKRTSAVTYRDLGLGAHAARASRGRYGPDDACHHDPLFLADGTCLFGQCGAAQSHLVNRGVGPGDIFLFFGLFREDGGAAHHRLFGYLAVEDVIDLAKGVPRSLLDVGHPHALAPHGGGDTVYAGRGGQARRASDALRLTVPEGPPSLWQVPDWLGPGRLSYHDRPDRWLPGGRLKSVGRGQEFVADIGRAKAPKAWIDRILAEFL